MCLEKSFCHTAISFLLAGVCVCVCVCVVSLLRVHRKGPKRVQERARPSILKHTQSNNCDARYRSVLPRRQAVQSRWYPCRLARSTPGQSSAPCVPGHPCAQTRKLVQFRWTCCDPVNSPWYQEFEDRVGAFTPYSAVIVA